MNPEEYEPEEQIPKDEQEEGILGEEKKEEPLLDSQGNVITPEDDKPKEPQNPLKSDLLKKSLKKLQKTYDGLSYAYIELDLKEKELDDIGEDLISYVHLRDVNLSNNKFTHLNPIANMKHLVRLDASVNEIKEINVFTTSEKFNYLQILNLKQNKIKELLEIHAKNLIDLNLEANLISTCSNFKGLPRVKKMNLNQNKLKTCIGLAEMPELEVLYLNQNRLKTMQGIENIPNLRKLRLRSNQFEQFDFIPILPKLEKLAISENLVKDVKQFSQLKFPHLTKINVDANPYFEDPNNAGAKIEILIQLEDFEIKFVNKEEVTPEDKEESKKVKIERIERERLEAIEKERERQEREEQERLERLEKEKQEKEEREEKERIEREEREREEQERQEELKRQREEEQNGEENLGEQGEQPEGEAMEEGEHAMAEVAEDDREPANEESQEDS